MAPPDRKGGGGLSLRTLTIASAASLTAAMVTSRLFPPGTIYASALTPVIVAAVSEMLNKPVDRVSQLTRQRRTYAMQSRTMEQGRILGEEPSPLAGAPEFAQGDDADRTLGIGTTGNGTGGGAPITYHRRERTGMRRVLHPKVWLVTGLVAFAVAVAALTLPELILGGAVATSKKTTFFGGGSHSTQTHTTPTQTQTQTTTATQTTTTVTQTQTATTPAPAQTQTTTTDTGTTTAPSGGTPAPGTTDTTTTTP